jgi:hypothetical protein
MFTPVAPVTTMSGFVDIGPRLKKWSWAMKWSRREAATCAQCGAKSSRVEKIDRHSKFGLGKFASNLVTACPRVENAGGCYRFSDGKGLCVTTFQDNCLPENTFLRGGL